MSLFVNLPLSFAANEPRYIDMLIEQGVSPELGMDTFAVQNLDIHWHAATAKKFSEAGLSCGIHLPFFDLAPGSLNDQILEATRATLLRALEISQVYKPTHFVGHPDYEAGQHDFYYDEWLSRSYETWSQFLKKDGLTTQLFLENTYEKTPKALVDLVNLLPADRVSHCFDVGHWHSFAKGAQRNDLLEWLNAFSPRLGHLHLHDNDGLEDQHLALGAGTIPLLDLFDYIQKNELFPTATLEPHTEDAFPASIEFLEAHSTSVCFLVADD
ncbi:sugar phosphate isomerase/epimerase family protein [Halodesulfovibrio marinisediminis]|uniref:Sugar phosphate isomerase/epimerase n=1 Tax=Halodesulfovibrio marinisediminis DSM 17456 TaxID=1121457 RepID=A0A1N6FJ14_9BACT|nr:TIM barrel protein [Halodesulfovibrio marinisediminis]SIN95220.1 Sugar phosphate isomerase/epimerase [Halodesulfovibrio marinisediminis DSM 17456]